MTKVIKTKKDCIDFEKISYLLKKYKLNLQQNRLGCFLSSPRLSWYIHITPTEIIYNSSDEEAIKPILEDYMG